MYICEYSTVYVCSATEHGQIMPWSFSFCTFTHMHLCVYVNIHICIQNVLFAPSCWCAANFCYICKYIIHFTASLTRHDNLHGVRILCQNCCTLTKRRKRDCICSCFFWLELPRVLGVHTHSCHKKRKEMSEWGMTNGRKVRKRISYAKCTFLVGF
jgi:hypothetical protein